MKCPTIFWLHGHRIPMTFAKYCVIRKWCFLFRFSKFMRQISQHKFDIRKWFFCCLHSHIRHCLLVFSFFNSLLSWMGECVIVAILIAALRCYEVLCGGLVIRLFVCTLTSRKCQKLNTESLFIAPKIFPFSNHLYSRIIEFTQVNDAFAKFGE